MSLSEIGGIYAWTAWEICPVPRLVGAAAEVAVLGVFPLPRGAGMAVHQHSSSLKKQDSDSWMPARKKMK